MTDDRRQQITHGNACTYIYITWHSTVFAGPPLMPVDLSGRSLTARSVELQWTPGPDGGHQQTFTVEYRLDGGNYKLHRDVIRDQEDAIIERITVLNVETKYEFQVTAHNTLGASPPATVTVITRGMCKDTYRTGLLLRLTELTNIHILYHHLTRVCVFL